MKKECIECKNDFEFKTHNQKYCSNQCCRIATNKRIMEKYYQKRARLRGQVRLCSCGNSLSRYNPEQTCTTCFNMSREKKKYDAREAIKVVISNPKKNTGK